MNKSLNGLYYPFSRCINTTSLKQLLLIFDKVSFLDPVDSDEWRAKLFKDIESENGFRKYRDVHNAIPTLLSEKAIEKISPIQTGNHLATLAAVSDLLDPSWVQLIERNGPINIPYQALQDGTPIWQSFLPKMPVGFIDALNNDHALKKNILIEGDEKYAWTLTYAAGSAAAINLHLSVAAEKGVSLITDSELHHKLLIMKLARNGNLQRNSFHQEKYNLVKLLSQKVAMSLVENIVPEETLISMSFDEILRFRDDSRQARGEFIKEMEFQVMKLSNLSSLEDFDINVMRIEGELRGSIREYEARLQEVKRKILPSMLSSLTSSLTPGSAAALTASYIGNAGYALLASVLTISLSLLKSGLDLRVEEKKIEEQASPALSYLSKVKKLKN